MAFSVLSLIPLFPLQMRKFAESSGTMRLFHFSLFITVILCKITGCATITGGSSYFATVVVNSKPEAEIVYQGRVVGRGKTILKVQRRDADKLFLTVREEGCEPFPVSFSSKDFRAEALVANLFLPFGLAGVLVDGLTGAFYMPSVNNETIRKIGIRNFLYTINLPECLPLPELRNAKKPEPESAVFELFNGEKIRGILLEKVNERYYKVKDQDNQIRTIPWEEVILVSPGE